MMFTHVRAALNALLRPTYAARPPHRPKSSDCTVNGGRIAIAPECERLVNQQIALELSYSHAYLAMAAHFARPAVALRGCAAFFLAQSADERGHAAVLIAHLNQRGGSVRFGQRADMPEVAAAAMDDVEWRPSMEQAIRLAVELEQQNAQTLLEMLDEAQRLGDVSLGNFLSGDFLTNQVADIAVFETLLAQLRMLGAVDGLGAYMLDRLMAKKWPCTGGEMKIILG